MTKTDQFTARPEPSARPHRPPLMWVVLAIGIVVYLVGANGSSYQGKLGEVLKQDNTAFLPDSADSTKVANEAPKFTTVQSIPGFIVYQREGGLTTADKAKVAADLTTFAKVDGVAADELGKPLQGKSDGVYSTSVPLVYKDGGKTVSFEDLGKTEKKLLETARANAPDGLQIYEAGAAGLIGAFSESFEGLDTTLLIVALIVVYVILLLVYRSPFLPLVPLFAAFTALGLASILIYYLAKNGTITLDGQSQAIYSILVIGAGTDYALLFISRYREELHEFVSPVDAIVAAWRGTVAPIGASAITVILGLTCLSFADLKSTAGLGPVCAISVGATVLTMLTVLPLLLLFFGRLIHWLWPVGWVLLALDFKKRRMIDGRWVFWPKRPRLDHETDILAVHGIWGRFATWLSAHSRRSWVVATVLLLACIAALPTLKTEGLQTKDAFTGSPEAITGQDIYDANFDAGGGAPAQVLVAADQVDTVIAAAKKVEGIRADGVCITLDYGKVAQAIKDAGGGAPPALGTGCAPQQFQVSPVDGQLLVDAPLTVGYDSPAGYDTIKRLRSTLDALPGVTAYVGGQTAAQLDVRTASVSDRDLIIPIVLLVILVVLGLVLRALVAPVLLILTVVLSYLAALGVSALVFNHVFGFANADAGFPLFAFVFLVALGIDYNIFLMTRVREETLEHGTRDGITRGLAVTGGVITSAGVVLAATFVVLGIVPLVFLAELGFTVAFGVVLDTVLVRSILVPALSHDIGKRIWWPSKLAASSARD